MTTYRSLFFAACALMLFGTMGCKTVALKSAYAQVSNPETRTAAAADSRQSQASAAQVIVNRDTGLDGEDPGHGKPQLHREIIYTGLVYLVVDHIEKALDDVQSLSVSLGGYMQQLEAGSITIRVPAARFDEAIAALEKMGEVTKKEISAQDVTEEVLDLRLRLKNAEAFRDRLQEMLASCKNVEEALAVEKELQRVTETIELLKGKIQYIESNVAYSTLTVKVNSPLPQQDLVETLPFPWIEELAADLSPASKRPVAYGKVSTGGIKLTLPASFVKFSAGDDQLQAMNADGVMVKVSRRLNYDNGSLDFWTKLIQRSLVQRKSLKLAEGKTLSLGTGASANVINGVKEIARNQHGYLLCIACDAKYVYTYEAWGLNESLAAERAGIEASMATLKVK